MEISQPSKVNLFALKILHFIVALFLIEQIIGTSFTDFIDSLFEKGIIDFRYIYIIWGEGLWPNILHIIILIFLAGFFGFVFGYLQPKLSISEKIIFALLYTFFRFWFLYLLQLFENINLLKTTFYGEILNNQINIITSSGFNVLFFILGLVTTFYFSLKFMNIGINTSKGDPPREKGTLAGIKWFHYLWLYIPIMTYSHLFLKVTYIFFNSIYATLRKFHILDFLFRGGGGYGQMSEEGEYSIMVILAFIVIVLLYCFFVLVLIYLLKYLRSIIIGETKQSLVIKILLVILIGFAIPVLIQYYYFL